MKHKLGTIQQLRQKGLLSTLPIDELIELMSEEILGTMEIVDNLRPAKRKVSKSVQSIAPSAPIAPYHDHESDTHCHLVGESIETNKNDVFGNLGGIFQ